MNNFDYSTYIFDCDGVVLNSNQLKTEAFRTCSLPFGELASDAMVEYHINHGGISRYKKFKYFIDTIIPKFSPNYIDVNNSLLIEELLEKFKQQVRIGLMGCEVMQDLCEFRCATTNSSWVVVSGGDQQELRDVFESRGLDYYFDGGIFGSPKDKYQILNEQILSGRIRKPGLFFGDSKLDHQVAKAFDLEFVFVSQWTVFISYEPYCLENNVLIHHAPYDFIRLRE